VTMVTLRRICLSHSCFACRKLLLSSWKVCRCSLSRVAGGGARQGHGVVIRSCAWIMTRPSSLRTQKENRKRARTRPHKATPTESKTAVPQSSHAPPPPDDDDVVALDSSTRPPIRRQPYPTWTVYTSSVSRGPPSVEAVVTTCLPLMGLSDLQSFHFVSVAIRSQAACTLGQFGRHSVTVTVQ